MDAPRPTVLLADDHQLFLQGLAHLVEHQGGYHVVGMARTGEEALELARTHRPRISLLDLHMPPPNGLDLGTAMKQEGLSHGIILLTMHHSASLVRRVKALGFHGYLLKNAGADELLAAMNNVVSGGHWFPTIAELPMENGRERLDLTARELEVLRGIASGQTNALIAEQLGIALRTAETHRKNINHKLGTNKTSELVLAAQRLGLV